MPPRRRDARRAARHVGRHAHRLLTWLASVAAVLTLIAGIGVWRLMQGPVELDWLLPYVQAGFARAGTGLAISMSGVRLGIDGATRQLNLQVEDVRLSLPSGEGLASFPEMATSFSLGSLLRGRLAPTQLTVEHPVVHLSRDKGGGISFRIGDAGAATGFDIAAALIGPPQADAPLGLLSRLRVHDATAIVDDELLGRRWQADHLDAAIERDEQGSTGDLSVAVTLGGETAELHASYRYEAARRKLDLGLSADGVQPDAFASLLPALAPLAEVHFPVSGTVQSQFDFDEHKFEGLRVDLGFGGGWLHSDQFPGGRLALAGGELHAVYAPETHLLRLDRLSFDLGDGALLVVAGHIDGVTRGLVASGGTMPGSLPGRFDLTLTHVPVARAGALWPLALSPGGRRWVVENVRDGVLDEATGRIDLTIDPESHAADLVAARGTLRYHDIAVNYFNGLPLLQHVGGTATVSDKAIDFTPDSGNVKSIKVTGGAVRVTDLAAHDQTAAVDLTVSGPLRDALEILDAKPLRYAHDAGLDPAAVAGKIETQLHFKFPLVDHLKFDDVDYTAKATVTGAAVAKIVLGRNLGDGNFAVDLTRTGVHVKGEARFDGVPATIDANVAFHPKTGPRAVYRVGLTLDDAARQRLDRDFLPERLSGPVAIDLTYSVRDAARASAALAVDLRAARLAIAEAQWQKPAGQPGTAHIDVDLERGAIAGPIRVAVAARGLDGRFAIALSPDRGQTDRVEIIRLVVGGDDIGGSVTRRGGGWHADIIGRRVDLHPLLKHALASDKGAPSPPFTVSARVERVSLGPSRIAQGVSAELSRADGGWQSMRVDGNYPNGHRFAFRLGGQAGPHRLSIDSDDLGAALRLFDVADNVTGGTMNVTGQIADEGGKPILRAQIIGSDYSVVRTPIFTRILSLASFSGLTSMMAGSGIPFTTLRGQFTYTDDGVVLDRLLAYGGALGITASGSVDLVHDTLDLKGTIAPAHTLNSVLGNVPVIGSLLMGGEGQSLFAANYELSGPTGDPAVSVNPLSAIAPGFLRRLFVVPDFNGGEEPPQPPP